MRTFTTTQSSSYFPPTRVANLASLPGNQKKLKPLKKWIRTATPFLKQQERRKYIPGTAKSKSLIPGRHDVAGLHHQHHGLLRRARAVHHTLANGSALVRS